MGQTQRSRQSGARFATRSLVAARRNALTSNNNTEINRVRQTMNGHYPCEDQPRVWLTRPALHAAQPWLAHLSDYGPWVWTVRSSPVIPSQVRERFSSPCRSVPVQISRPECWICTESSTSTLRYEYPVVSSSTRTPVHRADPSGEARGLN